MCGRARCSLTREAVQKASAVPEQRWRDQERYRPSYNCTPGAWIPVIKLGADGARELQTMKWGLVPAFTRLAPGEGPNHFRMFNARTESLAQKSVFSRLLPGKRCVVVMDGFYEWQELGGGGGAAKRKQPYYITTADEPQQPAMYLAGLYDVFHDDSGEPLHTFTIATTGSSKPLEWLHDRMPVILTSPEEVSAWLGEGNGAAAGGSRNSSLAVEDEAKTKAEVKCDAEAMLGHLLSPPHPAPRVACPSDTATGPGSTSGHSAVETGFSSGTQPTAEASVGFGEGTGRTDEGGGLGATKGSKGGMGERAVRQRCEALVEQICRPYGGPLLHWHPVTPDMSKPRYDNPDCCKDARTRKGSISSFFKPLPKTEGTSAAAAAAEALATGAATPGTAAAAGGALIPAASATMAGNAIVKTDTLRQPQLQPQLQPRRNEGQRQGDWQGHLTAEKTTGGERDGRKEEGRAKARFSGLDAAATATAKSAETAKAGIAAVGSRVEATAARDVDEGRRVGGADADGEIRKVWGRKRRPAEDAEVQGTSRKDKTQRYN